MGLIVPLVTVVATRIHATAAAGVNATVARSSFRPPNGWRVSGERRAEGDERVRCTRMMGGAHLFRAF